MRKHRTIRQLLINRGIKPDRCLIEVVRTYFKDRCYPVVLQTFIEEDERVIKEVYPEGESTQNLLSEALALYY